MIFFICISMPCWNKLGSFVGHSRHQDQRDNGGFLWPKDWEKMNLSWEWSRWWQPWAIAIGTRIPIKCRADHLEESLNTRRPLLSGNKEAISATWEDSTALICGEKSTALREVSLPKVLILPTSLDRHLLGELERAGRDGPKDRGIFLLTVCPTSLSHLLLLLWVVFFPFLTHKYTFK